MDGQLVSPQCLQTKSQASWQLALAASGAGLSIVEAEPFVGLESLYRPSGHRDQGGAGGDSDDESAKGEYTYHTRDPRIYTLVPAAAAAAAAGSRPLAPVAGPVFAHEIHLWCHTSLLQLSAPALEELLRAAVLQSLASAGLSGDLKAMAQDCLAGLRFVERCVNGFGTSYCLCFVCPVPPMEY